MAPITTSHRPLAVQPYSFVGSHVFEEMALRARQRGDTKTLDQALFNLHHLALLQQSTKNPALASKLWPGLTEDPQPGQVYPNEKPGVAEVYTFTAKQGRSLPGTLIIHDNQKPDEATEDNHAKEVHDSSKSDYLPYLKKYKKLDSMDGKGIDHYHTVHYGVNYNNAFMNGKQMAYGDGDGINFNSFAQKQVGIHENSHLKTQETAGSDLEALAFGTQVLGGLIYRGQSGALNEHYSDFDAIFVYLSQVEAGIKFEDIGRDFWLLGAGLLVRPRPDGSTSSLRSFLDELAYDDKALGKDIQPKRMKNYYKGPRDNYGVHINSGIVNHGVYLSAKYICEGLDIDVLEMVEIMTAVWQKALTRMHNRTTFKEAVRQWLKAAKDLYPEKPQIHDGIKKAFEELEVIGANAVEVDEVIELYDDFDLAEYNVDKGQYQNLQAVVDDSTKQLESIPGYYRAGVGARLNGGQVQLVIMLFVEDKRDDVSYPKNIAGYDVVVREEVPVVFETDTEHDDPFSIIPENVVYLK